MLFLGHIEEQGFLAQLSGLSPSSSLYSYIFKLLDFCCLWESFLLFVSSFNCVFAVYVSEQQARIRADCSMIVFRQVLTMALSFLCFHGQLVFLLSTLKTSLAPTLCPLFQQRLSPLHRELSLPGHKSTSVLLCSCYNRVTVSPSVQRPVPS